MSSESNQQDTDGKPGADDAVCENVCAPDTGLGKVGSLGGSIVSLASLTRAVADNWAINDETRAGIAALVEVAKATLSFRLASEAETDAWLRWVKSEGGASGVYTEHQTVALALSAAGEDLLQAAQKVRP